jgi:hypothetical protein
VDQGLLWALRRVFPLCTEPTPAGTPGRPHAVHAARQVAAGLARTHALQLALDLVVHVVLHLKHIEPVDCYFSRTPSGLLAANPAHARPRLTSTGRPPPPS